MERLHTIQAHIMFTNKLERILPSVSRNVEMWKATENDRVATEFLMMHKFQIPENLFSKNIRTKKAFTEKKTEFNGLMDIILQI